MCFRATRIKTNRKYADIIDEAGGYFNAHTTRFYTVFFTNITSDLSQGGTPSAEPAAADIVVEAARSGVAIPVTTPLGTLVLVALIAAAALWHLRWRV